jgi:hypothetical protein
MSVGESMTKRLARILTTTLREAQKKSPWVIWGEIPEREHVLAFGEYVL